MLKLGQYIMFQRTKYFIFDTANIIFLVACFENLARLSSEGNCWKDIVHFISSLAALSVWWLMQCLLYLFCLLVDPIFLEGMYSTPTKGSNTTSCMQNVQSCNVVSQRFNSENPTVTVWFSYPSLDVPISTTQCFRVLLLLSFRWSCSLTSWSCAFFWSLMASTPSIFTPTLVLLALLVGLYQSRADSFRTVSSERFKSSFPDFLFRSAFKRPLALWND